MDGFSAATEPVAGPGRSLGFQAWLRGAVGVHGFLLAWSTALLGTIATLAVALFVFLGEDHRASDSRADALGQLTDLNGRISAVIIQILSRQTRDAGSAVAASDQSWSETRRLGLQACPADGGIEARAALQTDAFCAAMRTAVARIHDLLERPDATAPVAPDAAADLSRMNSLLSTSLAAISAGVREPHDRAESMRLAGTILLALTVLGFIGSSAGFINMASRNLVALKKGEEALTRSRDRFVALFESAPDAVIMADAQGRIVEANAQVQRLFGWSPEELKGRPIGALIPVELQPRHAQAADGFRHDGNARAVSDGAAPPRALRRDGTGFPVEISLSPMKTPGEPFAIAAVRDITERLALTERLRAELERTRAVIESGGAAIVVVDREMHITLANRAFEAIAGHGAAGIIGRPLLELIDCPLDPEIIRRWQAHAAAAPLQAVTFDRVTTGPDHCTSLLHVTATPTQSTDGRLQSIIFLGIDATAYRRAEDRAREAERLATVGGTASMVAHEVAQPLTFIGLCAENLDDDLRRLPADARLDTVLPAIHEALEQIVDQTHRASSIIDDLRRFSRKSASQLQPFDVGETVGVAVHLATPQLRLAGIAIEVSAQPCPPALGDANRLNQILVNLIGNARDAIRSGGATQDERHGTIRLVVRHEPEARMVAIDVEDDGPGIPDDVMPRLFETFFTTKPPETGTGLGLSICQRLAEEMKGTISAVNRAEGGACFTVHLPEA